MSEEILTRWQDPTIEELKEEIIELNKDIEFRQKVIDGLCETKKMYRERIDKAIEDLEQTKRYNLQHSDKIGNVFIELDIDHLDYLINILKGGNNE